MKRLFFIFLLALNIALYGQQNSISIGAEGGFSIASLRGNIFPKGNPRIGYMSGLSVQYNFSKIFSIRTGIYHESKGNKLTGVSTSTTNPNGQIDKISVIEKFEYMTIPLLARVTFGNRTSFFVNTGPYIGILIKQIEHINTSPERNIDNSSNFQKTELGFCSGIGLSQALKQRMTISLEVRNNLGLENIANFGNSSLLKTNSLNLLLGFSYRLG